MQKNAKNVYVVHGGGVKDAGEPSERSSEQQNVRVYAGVSKVADEIFGILGRENSIDKFKSSFKSSIVFTGGLVEKEKGQQKSESEHMIETFKKGLYDVLIQKYQNGKIVNKVLEIVNSKIIKEDESINSIQNIKNVIKKILGSGETDLTDQTKLVIISNEYHLKRLGIIYKNILKKNKVKNVEIQKLSAESYIKKFLRKNRKNSDLNSFKNDVKNEILQWQKNRSISSKIRENMIEFFGTLLAMIKKEEILSTIPSSTPITKSIGYVIKNIFKKKI